MPMKTIKAKIIESGKTMSEVAEAIQIGTLQNLSQKMSRETLKYTEAEKIAAACGYEIVWKKREG